MAQRGKRDNRGTFKISSSRRWRRAALGGAALACAIVNTVYVAPVEATMKNNSGTIAATATAYAFSTTDYYPHHIGTDPISLTNSGSITATATITAIATDVGSNSAWGVVYGNDLIGTLINSGTITATAVAEKAAFSISAAAYGIEYVSHYGGLLNTSIGTISAIAKADNNDSSPAEAYACGIEMAGLDNGGSLTNEGYIAAGAYAHGSNARASAAGISLNDLDGSLTNHSLIHTISLAESINGLAKATAYGIEIDGDLNGTLLNSGSGMIVAIADVQGSGDTDLNAYGVNVSGSLNANLVNSGIIAGIAGDRTNSAYSLYIADGTATVSNRIGGVLHGNLYAGGSVSVDNRGTITLPVGANAYIGGDYHQGVGGSFRIDADSSSDYGQLIVNGNAVLSDDTNLYVYVSRTNTLRDGETLADVLSATNLTVNSLVVSDNHWRLDFSPINNDNTIDLEVSENSVGDIISLDGTYGASGAAALFDRFYADNYGGDGMADVLMALDNLRTARQVSDAINQSLPILNGGMGRVVAGTNRGLSRIIQARQGANRGMNSGDDFFTDRHFWAKPFASTARQSDNNGTCGYDADSSGLVIGTDGKVGDDFRLGFSFAYSNSDIDGNGTASQQGEVESYLGTVYGSHDLGGEMAVNWQVDYGVHSNETTRYMPLLGAVAKADYDSWSGHIGGGFTKNYVLNREIALIPAVRLDYTMIKDNGYSETGAGALNLNVDSNDTDELVLTVDGGLSYGFGNNKSLTARLGLGYDMLAGDDSISSSYAGAANASFVTTGVEPSPWLVNGGLGLAIGSEDKLALTIRYDIEGRDNYSNQSVSFKVNKSF